MDQELIAYLDRRFGDLGQDLDRRFGALDGKIGDLDRRFEDLDGKIGDLREHVDTQNRYTHVVVEDLRSKVDLLAESIVDRNAERGRSEADHERARQEDRAFCDSLYTDVKGRVDDHEDRISACEARVRKIESAGG